MGGCFLLFMTLYSVLLPLNVHGAGSRLREGPRKGFTSLPLNASNFFIHKPYDLAVSDRYSFIDGIHKLWVLASDKPFKQGSPTRPRTEIRIRVNNPPTTAYSSSNLIQVLFFQSENSISIKNNSPMSEKLK